MRKNKIAIVLASIVVCMLAATVLFGCSEESGPSADPNALHNRHNNPSSTSSTSSSSSDNGFSTGKHHVRIKVAGYEPIEIELDADAAPLTVQNFCELVEDGFYDGLSFYRFQEGFCIQGGSANYSAASDPNDTSKTIKGEFSGNGVENPLAEDFKRGTVAMARSMGPDSAATTFFVTMSSDSMVGMSLNGQYAAFGAIDENGMKVMDEMMNDFAGKVDDPTMGMIEDKENQAIIESIEIVD